MPATGPFIIQINDELMYCSAVASETTITVSARGYLGTDNQSHLDKTPVYIWGMDHYHTTSSWANTATIATEGIDSGNLRRCKTVGVARSRAFEVGAGAFGSLTLQSASEVAITGAHTRASTFHHYIFDVRMLTKLTITAASNIGFDATHFLHNGARIKGSSSGATGIVYIAPQDVQFTMTAVTANADATVTVPSTAGLEVGMGVKFGAGVPSTEQGYMPADAYILSITSDVTFELSANCTGNVAANGTGNLLFGNAADRDDGTKIDRGTTFHVIQTTGTFTTNDTISCNFSGDLATSGKNPLTATKVYGISDAHSLYGQNAAAGKEYVADIVPRDAKKLRGTVTVGAVEYPVPN